MIYLLSVKNYVFNLIPIFLSRYLSKQGIWEIQYSYIKFTEIIYALNQDALVIFLKSQQQQQQQKTS